MADKEKEELVSETVFSRDEYKHHFDAYTYLKEFYSECDNEPAMHVVLTILPNIVSRLPQGKRLLDVGSGPTVHVPMCFRHKIQAMYLCDYSIESRKQLFAWLLAYRYGQKFDWSSVTRFIAKREGTMKFVKYNVSEWIENHKIYFVPPVCNKCMFSDQLKAFLVSGPNLRKDFHLEEGEELFYMLKGDMCLRTVNLGIVKDIDIKAGQIYTPQRNANTIGLVVERHRADYESDCLRFFENEKTFKVAFEQWFHMTDAEAGLPPIIFQYLKNSENRKPFIKTSERPYEADDNALLEQPLDLQNWIRENSSDIQILGSMQLYGPPKFKSQVLIYGPGTHQINTSQGEIFIWFMNGNGYILSDGKRILWKAIESTKIQIGFGAKIICEENSYFMTVMMPTPTEKSDLHT